MSKIKVFCVILWFMIQGVIIPPSSARASSGCDIGDCAKGDALIITMVSAGLLILEKISEKIYKYFMSRRRNNQISEAEQTDGLENNNNTIIRYTEQAEEV